MQQRYSGRFVTATVAMTFIIQAFTSFAMSVPAVIAPVAAADLGFAPGSVGVLVSSAYVAAILLGLAGGPLIMRFGPVRLFQFAAIFVGIGLVCGAGAHILLAFTGVFLLGVAHGLINPASSQVLAQSVPVSIRSMVFSIKQTGVPAGTAISGVLLPFLLLSMRWQTALLMLSLVSLVFLPLMHPFRAEFDRKRTKSGPKLTLSNIASPLLEVCANPPLLELAICSAIYSGVQLCLLTYLVSYLKLGLGYSLVLAGAVYSVASVTGVFGRILWGTVADRLFSPRMVLAGLGIAMSFCGIATASFTPDWPLPLVFVVCAVYALTAAAWNGVYLAEVVRFAPPESVGRITGGTQVFTFGGAMAGPPIFGATVALSGGYAWGYILFAVFPMIMGLRLFLARPAPPRARTGAG